MDEQYTPTTAEVCEGYAHLTLNPVADAAAFDRWLLAHDREVAEKAAKIADDFAREHEDSYGVAPQHAIQAANEIAERIRQSIEGEQR